MKLFKFTCGLDEKIGVFVDEQDAYERRAEVDATFHFLPVTIEEIAVPGYEITITPIEPVELDNVDETLLKPPEGSQGAAGDEFDAMEADQLRAWLDERKVKYHPQMGEKKLRERCRSVVAQPEEDAK